MIGKAGYLKMFRDNDRSTGDGVQLAEALKDDLVVRKEE